MKCFTIHLVACLVLLSSVSVSVLSAQADPLVAQIDAYIVTNAPDSTVILYRASFEDQSNAVLDAVKPTIPIPVGLEYVAKSVKPKPKEVSLARLESNTPCLIITRVIPLRPT